ncbi:MAG: hypothetical protein HZB99_00195 [Candidatus Harrisonbacteria bacterium]|nr:hypothetical protein [Candidatus Harrisonbacteria bacterium]
METFKNTNKAIKRLLLAKKQNEKIGIWGDYDPDGIPGATLIYEAMIGADFDKNNLTVILPNQREYDRSFNLFHLRLLKSKKASLIVGVDFGSSDFSQVVMAKKMGFDIILLDHHICEPGKLLAILINPKQRGERFSYKNWCGTGVAYKFFESFYSMQGLDLKRLELSLDLFAMAMAADGIEPDEGNIKYWEKGVDYLNRRVRPGVRMLLKEAKAKKLDKKVMLWGESDDYVLRAAVHGDNRNNNLFQLLTTKDPRKAAALAKDIKNHLRKFNEAIKNNVIGGTEIFKKENKPSVVFFENRSKLSGTSSMTADKLSSKLRVPIFVYKKFKKGFRGNIRAVYPSGLNVVEAMSLYKDLLVSFGGHPVAAGFYLEKGNLSKFKKAMEQYFSNLIK